RRFGQRAADFRLQDVESCGALADNGYGRGVDEREEIAEAVSHRPSRLSKGLAGGSLLAACEFRELLHLAGFDIDNRLFVRPFSGGAPPYRVGAGIGFNAAPAPATAERTTRLVDHVAELP